MGDICSHCGNELPWVAPGICKTCFQTKAGGQAFPSMDALGHKDYQAGLSQRDWFAGMILQGMMANDASGLARSISERKGEIAIRNTARLAYIMADGMIRERSRGG